MSGSMSTNQAIKTNTGVAADDQRLLSRVDIPATGLANVELFTAYDMPNRYGTVNEFGTPPITWNPLEGPADHGAGYKTRVLSFAAKSTNSGDVTIDGTDIHLVLKPGTGFMLTSPYSYSSAAAITNSTAITVNGTATDYASVLWGCG